MTTTKQKIVIIDDQPDRSKGWADQIQKVVGASADVIAFDLDTVRSAVKSVFNRRKAAGDGGFKDIEELNIPSVLDTVDILILDYDLRYMDQADSIDWTTGEEVAVAARVFTKVKSTILLNRQGNNRFDLDMNKAILSPADTDIGSAQIGNPGLWRIDTFEQYRPWFWPPVLEWSQKFESTVKLVLENFDQPISPVIGLNAVDEPFEESINKEHWLELGIDPIKGTFKELIEQTHFLNPRDKKAISNSPSQSARVGAAIIRSWLEKLIIPSQETLVDAPHLAYLMPWVLKDPQDPKYWDIAANLTNPFDAFKPEVSECLFNKDFSSRPVFYRRKIETNKALSEPPDFSYSKICDLVFGEDVSRFIPFENSRPYPSGLRCQDDQRYVADPVKLTSKDAHKVADVSYEPAAKFAI